MKKTILIFSILTYYFSQITLAQDAPIRLGDFVVGETVIRDFDWIISKYNYTGPKRYSEKSVASCKEDEVEDNREFCTIFPNVYRIKDDIGDTTESLAKFSSMLNPDPKSIVGKNTQCFFIDQLKIEDHCINNIYLKFFEDTLIQIEYSSNTSLFKILVEKYKRKATKTYDKTTISGCSKKIKNRYVQYILHDTSTRNSCIINSHLLFTKDCENMSYIKLMIGNFNSIEEQGFCINETIKIRKAEARRIKEEKREKELANF